MPLVVGAKLGPYEILELIGAGGMGEVYRARDAKLGREVAVKILPEEFARHHERLARLRREAQVLAALNHPNIAAIYDLNESEEHCLLALELVPGPTLAERLRAGPLPWREARLVCRQIADGLAAAHEKGIIHRDLKPANVKITPEGRVKLLDFGLAKARLEGASGSGSTDLPTETQVTEVGAALGTIPYMSPEQVRAQPLDHRTDIWAFGCLLYEVLSGRPLFSGGTSSDILASILRDQPKLVGLPRDTPQGVVRLLDRCLRQDLSRRLQAIGDARIEIDDLDAEGVAPTAVAQSRPSRLLLLMAGVLAGCLLMGGLWGWFRQKQLPSLDVQFQRITDFVGTEESPALSPDGKTVAFVAMSGGRKHIWVRLLSGGAPLRITKDEGDHEQPRWATDSGSLLYFSPSSTAGGQGTLWETSALGGALRRIAPALGGADISHDGRRIAFFRLQSGRTELAVSARDGSGVRVVKAMPPESVFFAPRWSPDDRWLAFVSTVITAFESVLSIIPSGGGEERRIAHSDNTKGHAWLPDGSGLVYASSSGSTVYYPPTFNLRSIRLDSTAERQLTFGDASYVEPDVDPAGKLTASRIRSQSDIWRFPVTGSPAENTRGGTRITRQTAQAQTPTVSPDGRELAYLSDSGGHGNIWVANTDGSGVRQLTLESDPATTVGVPVWSPVSSQILFILSRAGKTGQWLVDRDGSGLREVVPLGIWAYWSGDGRWVYYVVNRKGAFCIDKAPIDGGTPIPVRCDESVAPAVSADGSTLYYTAQLKGGAGWDFELRRAQPENAPSRVLARIAGARVPTDPFNFHAILSPDEKWLAVPLTDGTTSNIWTIPTAGGPMRQLTDFGERPIVIARRLSWSHDSKSIYAAVSESDSDVVLLTGLVR